MTDRASRRRFLASATGLTIVAGAAARPLPAVEDRTPLAVLGTVYRPLSYTYHLAGRFLHGYPLGGRLHEPAQCVSTLWIDQVPENDLAHDLAKTHGIRRARSVTEALVDGSRLAVAGVMITAEHGNYPRNERGQVLYPRFETFAQVVSTFYETKQTAPIYVARHLSHDFDRAKQMVAWSKELGFPLLAGSPLPFTARSPDLDLPRATAMTDVLVACYGPVEYGGFEALEVLQCLVECRVGGETGVAAVTCLTGREVWRAADAGRWDPKLLEAALAHSTTANLGNVRHNVGTMAVAGMPATPAIAFLVEYTDGTRGTALLLNGHVQDVTAAVRTPTGVRAGAFEVLPPPGVRHFDHLAGALERFYSSSVAPCPAERHLLTTGLIAAGMASHAERGPRVATPHLEFGYGC